MLMLNQIRAGQNEQRSHQERTNQILEGHALHQHQMVETTKQFRQRFDDNDARMQVIEEKLTALELAERQPAVATATNDDVRHMVWEEIAQVEARIASAAASAAAAFAEKAAAAAAQTSTAAAASQASERRGAAAGAGRPPQQAQNNNDDFLVVLGGFPRESAKDQIEKCARAYVRLLLQGGRGGGGLGGAAAAAMTTATTTATTTTTPPTVLPQAPPGAPLCRCSQTRTFRRDAASSSCSHLGSSARWPTSATRGGTSASAATS